MGPAPPMRAVATAIAATDAIALAATLRAGGTASVVVDGAPMKLTPDEVVVAERPRHGWAVATDTGATVALDLTITPALRRAGIVAPARRG